MSYWRKRELEHIKKQIKDDKVIANKIRNNHLQAMEEIQTEINAFYGKYASDEGITMIEARKRATKLDMNKYERKAKRYVKEKDFSPKANEEMRLYNMTMKTQRLELLKANINLELVAMTDAEQAILLETLSKQAREEYKRQAGILGATLNYNEKNIASIVNSSFLSATWSDRLWDNQDNLRSELNRLLNRGIIQGKNPRELARDLRKNFESSVYNAERLLRTESARVQQDVFQDSAKQADIEQYEFIAEPDACPICSGLDGEIFYLKDAVVGENAYPIHPNCRCSQALYIDREEWDEDLKARGL